MARNILVIEDDLDMAELARLHLEDQGYGVEVESDGLAGRARVLHHSYDLIILDLMLPGVDGLDICQGLRARHDPTPLMILTARSTELDRIKGLELGADDYMVKPVCYREMVARVRALLRRADGFGVPRGNGNVPPRLERGELSIDADKRQVLLYGHEVGLTTREFDLLAYFARHPGRVFTRAQLLDSVWGYGYEGYEHTVNSHINRLRTKIEPDPARPCWILTVRGVGYKFTEGPC